MSGPTPLQVLSVPAGHPYPRRVLAAAGDRVRVDRDPDPTRRDRAADGVWWPHPGLEPAWLSSRRFDLLHLHFGFEHRTPEQLHDLTSFLRRTGRPLVLTVHDLRSPHEADASLLDRQLDVLVPRADAVVTLTAWAAREIRRRWGVEAVVIPHPSLVPAAAAAERRRRQSSAPVVSVSCKSLRTNVDPVRLLAPLERCVRRERARLRLLVHREVVERPSTPEQRRVAAALFAARDRGAELVVHRPFSDVELWDEVSGHAVAVLPYRFGTHSGWLHMAQDLGTFVAAPSFGGYGDQGADAVYSADEHEIDEASLESAVARLLARVGDGELAGVPAHLQAARALAITDQHVRLYDEVVARARTGSAA